MVEWHKLSHLHGSTFALRCLQGVRSLTALSVFCTCLVCTD